MDRGETASRDPRGWPDELADVRTRRTECDPAEDLRLLRIFIFRGRDLRRRGRLAQPPIPVWWSNSFER